MAVVDLTMPGMSGFELVNRLRQHPETQELPVFIYTARDLSADETTWLRNRVAAVTLKPFREQLIEELHGLCAASQKNNGHAHTSPKDTHE
jgi:CheY-like chemotaxis protein